MSRLYPAAEESRGPGLPPPAAPSPGGGLEIDIMARLAVCLDGLQSAAGRLALSRERDQCGWADCHPIPLAAVTTPGGTAGSIVDERWQPRAGFAWQVLLLTVTFLAGATSAVVYKTAGNEGLIPSNAKMDFLPDAAGLATWEPKGLILLPGTQLSWNAAGGGIVASGEAVEIALPRLAGYLM